MTKNSYYVEPEVWYPCTNESISAVVSGLDLTSSDVVISIAGSGDIPFSIAPYVKKVYAVDSDDAQLDFMRRQKGFLREGDTKSFYHMALKKRNWSFGHDINLDDLDRRKHYFSRHLEDVVSSLSRIEMVNLNVFDFMKNQDDLTISKVYLSNVLQSNGINLNDERFWGSLGCLNFGGLVYDATHGSAEENIELPFFLNVNRIKTSEARNIEKISNCSYWGWKPYVYVKCR